MCVPIVVCFFGKQSRGHFALWPRRNANISPIRQNSIRSALQLKGIDSDDDDDDVDYATLTCIQVYIVHARLWRLIRLCHQRLKHTYSPRTESESLPTQPTSSDGANVGECSSQVCGGACEAGGALSEAQINRHTPCKHTYKQTWHSCLYAAAAAELQACQYARAFAIVPSSITYARLSIARIGVRFVRLLVVTRTPSGCDLSNATPP